MMYRRRNTIKVLYFIIFQNAKMLANQSLDILYLVVNPLKLFSFVRGKISQLDTIFNTH